MTKCSLHKKWNFYGNFKILIYTKCVCECVHLCICSMCSPCFSLALFLLFILWGRSGWSLGRENHNQKILCKKIYFRYKKRRNPLIHTFISSFCVDMHLFMCVHMCERVHLYRCMHACRGQRSASCVFLHYSSYIFWGKLSSPLIWQEQLTGKHPLIHLALLTAHSLLS